MTQELWKIELFGPLSASLGTYSISRFRTHKTALLLAYLALNKGKAYQREELIQLIWTDVDLDSGRNALRVALTTLRNLLRFDQDNDDESDVLVADRNRIYLNPETFETDVEVFDRYLLAARNAPDDQLRAQELEKAVQVYRGDLLPGVSELWAQPDRQRLADQNLLALRRLVKVRATEKNFESALEYALRAKNADPIREESHRVLMQLYAATGRQAAALRQYREIEQLLLFNYKNECYSPLICP